MSHQGPTMAEPDFNLILRQYERILVELRTIRDEQRGMRLDLRSLRDEFGLLREQVRIQGAGITRLEDTMTMNVLERIQKLEEGQPS